MSSPQYEGEGSPLPMLVIVTGPVGGGKSATALRLAARLRAAGHSLAVIDLDLVAGMARPRKDYGAPDLWQIARRACADLADAFYRQGFDAVIVEGEFFSPAELAALREGLATPVALRFVTLDVSYEQALVRVSGDPTRGLSRDPAFLWRMHQQYLAALPFLRSAGPVLAADEPSPEELAEAILAHL